MIKLICSLILKALEWENLKEAHKFLLIQWDLVHIVQSKAVMGLNTQLELELCKSRETKAQALEPMIPFWNK